MYCKNCGKEINNGDAFCGSCGQPVQSTENVQGEKQEIVTKKSTKTISIKKETIKKFAPIVSAVAVALIIVIAIIVNLTTKVSLDDYVVEEISYIGIDGYGYVDTTDVIDYSALENEIIGEFNGSESMYNEDYWEYSFSSVNDYIDYSWSENNGTLSNGDTVVLTVTIDKSGMKSNKFFKKKISGRETQTFEYEVQGLEEGVVIDVFDAVSGIAYDTNSSNISIHLKDDYEKTYDNNITVKVENDRIRVYGDDFYSFSIGVETVTDNINENTKTTKLSIDCEPTEYVDYGLVINPEEKEFSLTVLSSIKDGNIKAQDIKTLKSNADALAKNLFDTSIYKFSKAVFYNCDSYYTRNTLVFYYTDGKQYYALRYDDMKKDQNGNVFASKDITAEYSKSWAGSIFLFNSIEACENNLSVTAQYPVTVD